MNDHRLGEQDSILSRDKYYSPRLHFHSGSQAQSEANVLGSWPLTSTKCRTSPVFPLHVFTVWNFIFSISINKSALLRCPALRNDTAMKQTKKVLSNELFVMTLGQDTVKWITLPVLGVWRAKQWMWQHSKNSFPQQGWTCSIILKKKTNSLLL